MSLRIGVSALALCVLASAPAGAKATITTFDVPGATETSGADINDDGTVTGTYVDSNRYQHGFVRAPDGAITTFDVEGASNTIPMSINQEGAIAGTCSLNRTAAGFLRDPSGKITTFNTDGFVEGVAINDRGIVAGTYLSDAFHGFVRNADGTIVTIRAGHSTQVHGINDREIVAGYSFKQKGRVAYGFVQRQPGGHVARFARDRFTEVYGINGSGTVVGRSGLDSHGFIRTRDGTITAFDPPGSTFTIPSSINDKGVVTGTYESGGRFHGFVRHEGGGYSTFDPRGSDATFPGGINQSGVITGQWEDDSGIHGFIRTP